MKIGIFTSTFVRPTLEETLDAIVSHGLNSVQFNMESAGLDEMPAHIDDTLCDRIRAALAARHIELSVLSGTFNMIHPDLEERARSMRSLNTLAAACRSLGSGIISLCTGTRSRDSMWRRHPENDSPEAWAEMIGSMDEAVRIAEAHHVTLAFEPEVNNVVDTADKARRLVDEIASPHLKVLIDGANIFHAGELPRMQEMLDHAFQVLGDDIVMAHAKDLSRDGDAGHEAAGTGLLDYDHYIHLLQSMDFKGSLILHSLEEHQTEECLSFVREKM